MGVKQKILIVDDDSNIAELIFLYLTKECFDVKIAEDGNEALDAFKQYHPDLVLLDLMLPGMDGYQVCREIRKTSHVPVIMMSAKGEVFDKVLGLELGADDYIVKPFDTKELVARIKAVLRRINPAQTDDSDFQFFQLLCHLPGQTFRYAPEGAGTAAFTCRIPQSGIYTGTTVRAVMGI